MLSSWSEASAPCVAGPREIAEHGRDDAGRAVGRRGDDAAAAGVLLVHRNGKRADRVHGAEVAGELALGVRRLPVERRRAALDVQAAGKDAFRAQAALQAVVHRVPDLEQPGARRRLVLVGQLVLPDDIGDRRAVCLRQSASSSAALLKLWQPGGAGPRRCRSCGSRPWPSGRARRRRRSRNRRCDGGTAGAVEGFEHHAVGMLGEDSGP